ncbi:MAG: selenocysteine-specific translation elongation factor [Dissulfurimicrobium hydrothermale]|uniref:selenocysteine-specific translation elongation factor n=1 Tax=Dissulfurimicrobium hydrothermale TaxID=1750598 RepID=UPI003C78D928
MQQKTLILGTAGHIDHGKTTLVKALTGIDTDRLKEEKRRGITIELGFAYLDLPNGQRIGVVDVPGHERFVKNMVAGAMGMDLVALVIAADEGVMPQTREHLEICQLLEVKKGLVVLTKKDMVDPEWLELVKEDIREFLVGTFLEGAPIVSVSSISDAKDNGIHELITVISDLVADIPPRTPSGPYRLPVDRVFSIKGFGTVVTGTSISGKIRVGDEAVIYPQGLKTKIRGIQIHNAPCDEAAAGMRTALNLQGIEREAVERGDVVATAGSLHPSYLLDLKFLYLSSAGRPLKYRSPVRFHTGTVEITGRVIMQEDEIEPGRETFIQIKLDKPAAVLPGDRYVIRSYSPIRTIGGGIILNPMPRRRKRSRPELWKGLEILSRLEPNDLIIYHLEQAGQRGLTQAELAMRSGVYGEILEQTLDSLFSKGKAVRIDTDEKRAIDGNIYRTLKKKILDFATEYHKENPLSKGIAKEEVRSRIFLHSPSGGRLFQKLLTDLVNSGDLIQEKDLLRLSTHKVSLGEEEISTRRNLEELFRKSGLEPPSREDAVTIVSPDKKTASNIFDLLVAEGVLVRIKEDLYYHRDALNKVVDLVTSFLKKNGEMAVGDFRDMTHGLSRKFIIPLLEYLDNQKITIRVGDKRKLRR